ncbi:conserved Plasmodium protein, unknown function [Plasmodium chabaudi chabaudi]|uniref:Uncharacterized protein n=1 Tax=Plasmodium chabaudi chabaudi TaxID=31271 RepID=A0A1C6XMN5_PLACU|nr:conserved Plasmodium protein, unknown function [Plasmodium chabaudi chabaudi]
MFLIQIWKIHRIFLIIFLCTRICEIVCYSKRISRYPHFAINPPKTEYLNFINKTLHNIKDVIKKRKHKKLHSIKISNTLENNIPEEYLKYNIPQEPIYPFITVPDNLYTRQWDGSKNNEEEGEGENCESSESIIETKEVENVGKEKGTTNPTIEDYINDINYEKYVHPSLIKSIDKNNQSSIPYNLQKHVDKDQKIYQVDCFLESDMEDDLTEYDADFNGIGPWPSFSELKKNNNNHEFKKTDMEIEYNISYDKKGYFEYKQKMLTDNKTNSNDSETKNDEEPKSETLPTTVDEIRKLYYKKDVKTIKEAKYEFQKWNERSKYSRKNWRLTKEEFDLLPYETQQLYLKMRKGYKKKSDEAIEKYKEYSAGGHKLLTMDQLDEKSKDNLYAEDEDKENEKINISDDIQNEINNNSNDEFRLLENNILYNKAKSPIDNMLYEWDDSLNCYWRERTKEVIRDVIMYDYPYKELRRPSNLDLYDISWSAGKMDIYITVEEGKNYKITLFDLKQLIKKIAKRLKDLEIEEDIYVLPFYELVVSSLPSQNILVCRRDWNQNIGKEVICFFKNKNQEPITGILLGSPSAFHVIININNEYIENVLIDSLDRIVIKDELKKEAKNDSQIMLQAKIDKEMDTEDEQTKQNKLEKEENPNLSNNESIFSDADELNDSDISEIEKFKKNNQSNNNDHQKDIKTIQNIDNIENDGSSNIMNEFDEDQDDEFEADEEYSNIADNDIDSYDDDYDDSYGNE